MHATIRCMGRTTARACRTNPTWRPLAAAATRLVVVAGEESLRQLTGRAAASLAEALGVKLVIPSPHGGFLGGEYGQYGQPERFAVRLREVLAGPRD